MITKGQIASCYSFNGCSWSSAALREAYTRVVACMQEAGAPPHRVGATGDQMPKKFATFARRRKIMETREFTGFEIVHMPEGGSSELTEWSVNACIFNSRLLIAWFPEMLARNIPEPFEELVRELATMFTPRIGCLFRQHAELCPACYAAGFGWGDAKKQRPYEHSMNISWWQFTRKEGRDEARLLRDVYPRSFLSRPYLDAPFGRTGKSLEAWIREDPAARGTLAPFTEQLTEWAPPVERIPALREELYRAGRLFYWRFFDPGEALHRAPESFDEPWEAPEPIPEIYRESFYADKDPGLVY